MKHPEMHNKLKVRKFFWRWKKILDEKKLCEKKFWKKKKKNFFFQKWKLLKIAWAAQKSRLGGGATKK